MKQDRPSLTAYKVAVMRAAHRILDNPKVFEDPIALKIIGTQGDAEIHSERQKFKTKLHRYLRAIVVARSRFVEDELSATIKRGVRQLDFKNQSLADQLQKAGFRTEEPSFFSWLGVTMYLTRETMMATMEYISSSTPSGSGIVFDCMVPPSSQNFMRRLIFRLLSKRVASFGEPWHTFYDPNSLIVDLQSIGFTKAEDVEPEEINARFFNNRADKLMVGNFGHLMKAQL